MGSKLDEQIAAGEERWLQAWKKGPQRLRWTELPLQVGDRAPNIQLPDSTGKLVALESLWRQTPALILFWRHYGCGCGVDRAARLKEEYPDYVGAGAEVAIIGQAEPERSAAYARKYELPPVTILCDVNFQAYRAFSLLEGKESQILFDAPEEFLDRNCEAGLKLAEARRAAGRPLVDNSWLLPGEFVVDQGGEVRLTYRYNYCEDFPDHRVLLAAIREARLARQ